MLPRMLCENLCSLAENEDRLAFSVIWRLDKDNNVLEEWFGRTVIRSCCKMAYGNAQSIINDPDLDWYEQNTIPRAKHYPSHRHLFNSMGWRGVLVGVPHLSHWVPPLFQWVPHLSHY